MKKQVDREGVNNKKEQERQKEEQMKGVWNIVKKIKCEEQRNRKYKEEMMIVINEPAE